MLMIPKYMLILLAFARADELTNLNSCDEKLENAFKAHQVVPDVIPKVPKECAYVEYPSGVEARLGNELTPFSVRDTPAVLWNANPEKYYLLAMVDPDAPSRAAPIQGQIYHWLVGNIPGDYLHSRQKSDTLGRYLSPSPGPDSGPHRYVFLVYEQPGKIHYVELRRNDTLLAGRTNFSIKNFASKYNLGDPVAGNFYLASYDSYVPFARAAQGDFSLLPCLTGLIECQ